MAGKTDPAKLNHAIELYLAGEPVQQITASLGISRVSLDRERARRGIPSKKTKTLPLEEAISAYLAGESATVLGRRYGMTQVTFVKRMNEAGVPTRGPEEATSLWFDRMPAEERQERIATLTRASLTSEALSRRSAGLTGLKRDAEQLARRALLREARAADNPFYGFISDGERVMRQWLEERGVASVPQKALGRYNVDLGIEPVAVEIMGGTYHARNAKHAIRTPKILDLGWHVLFVWNGQMNGSHWLPWTAKAADQVVSFVEEARRNPSMPRQYRVIRGDGQILAIGRRDDDELAFIPTLRDRICPRA